MTQGVNSAPFLTKCSGDLYPPYGEALLGPEAPEMDLLDKCMFYFLQKFKANGIVHLAYKVR